jgi:fructose-1,6-bisphosphatase II
MFDPGPAVYMQKLVVPPTAAGAVELDAPIRDTLANVAAAQGRDIGELTVAVLDRPRHQRLIAEIRETGARIRFLLDGDVAAAIMAVSPGCGVDVLVGTGGTAEGVLAACALRCLGGRLLGRLVARDTKERKALANAGYDLEAILDTETLVRGGNVFFAATGVTDGALLEGVRYDNKRVITQSLSMRSRSGTVRLIEGRHDPARSSLIDY